jgi:hypothetical protein
MSTDSTGKFSIDYNPTLLSTLNFSLIGYNTRKLDLKKTTQQPYGLTSNQHYRFRRLKGKT